MPSVRFGLYLIPPDGNFYRTGSAVTGYDIRAERELSPPEFLKASWQAEASNYGFHITITDAIDIDGDDLPFVSERVRQLLGCFKASNRYILRKERVGFWGENRPDAAIILKPNRDVELLHDVLVTAIHPLGSGSAYVNAYNRDPETYFADSPSRVNKTIRFFGPYIFDEFVPHFTCINPFCGGREERNSVETGLKEQFASFEAVEFDQIALVVKGAEDHFRILEEFDLHVSR
jgi:hypothetical protein